MARLITAMAISGRQVQLLNRIKGPFQESGIDWQIECWRSDDRAVSFTHTKLLDTAIAAIQRSEQREERRNIAHLLFNFPATFRFRIARVTPTTYTIIVTMDISLRGNTKHAKTHQSLTPIEQAIKLSHFFEYLAYQDIDRRRPWSKERRIFMPGKLAYHFWVNALLSRYCEFWGIE